MRRVRHGVRLASDLLAYSIINRVVWLIPLVLVLLVAAVVVTAGQVAAPFMYTIF